MKHFNLLLGAVAGLALFVMMWLTVFDVIGRKYFDHSITGAVELTEIAMMITIFFALPLTSLAGEHIVFDLIDRFVPAWFTRWQASLANLVTAAVFGGSAWIVFGRAARTVQYGDTTAQLAIPMGPFHYMIAAMLAVTAAMHLILALLRLPSMPLGVTSQTIEPSRPASGTGTAR